MATGRRRSSRCSLRFPARLIEAAGESRVARVRIIEEGPGNIVDAHYYGIDALKSLLPLLEGAPIYADHSGRDGRSVRDTIGWYSDAEIVLTPDGTHAIEASAHIVDGDSTTWAWDLIRAAAARRDDGGRAIVGISIDARGRVEPVPIEAMIRSESRSRVLEKFKLLRDAGHTTVDIVKSFDRLVSADLVSEAGAGGGIVQVLTEEEKMPDEKMATREIELPAMSDSEMPTPEEIRAGLMALALLAKKYADEATDEANKTKLMSAYERYDGLAKKLSETPPAQEKHKEPEIRSSQDRDLTVRITELEKQLSAMRRDAVIDRALAEVPTKLHATLRESLLHMDGEKKIGEHVDSIMAVLRENGSRVPVMEKATTSNLRNLTALFADCVQ